MKRVILALVAIAVVAVAANRLLGALEAPRPEPRSEAPSRYIDYDGNPYPDYVPIRPTSALSESTSRYRLVSKDGRPVTVTFGARYFEDVMGGRGGRFAGWPGEVERERGATSVASGTLFEVDGFDRLDDRLVTGRLLGPDLSGQRITYTVCVARQDLAPL